MGTDDQVRRTVVVDVASGHGDTRFVDWAKAVHISLLAASRMRQESAAGQYLWSVTSPPSDSKIYFSRSPWLPSGTRFVVESPHGVTTFDHKSAAQCDVRPFVLPRCFVSESYDEAFG